MGAAAQAAPSALSSPDGRIAISIQWPEPDSDKLPRWSATFKGTPLLKDCEIGLKTPGTGDLFSGIAVLGSQLKSVEESIPVHFGKADKAQNRFEELRFSLESRTKQKVAVVFRCTNDAIAFRYELPGNGDGQPFTISDESTSFQIAGDPTAYAQHLDHYKTPHEQHVTQSRYRDVAAGKLLGLPLTFRWEDGAYVAITEAALRNYAGMALMRVAEDGANPRLVCKLTPRADGSKVVRSLPMQAPWRVVLIGDRPGALLESNTIYCLNEPSAIADLSWIKPGKITFSWWNGDVYDGKRGGPILSLELARKYIDFCARNGIPTHSLTSTEPPTTPWYQQSKKTVEPGPDTDVTRPREGFEFDAIREYATSKQIRLWTWVHQAALRGRVDEAFAAFAKMGWSGLMVDFFDHDDQDSVEFAESIVQAAARHKILVQLHGVWKPTGWERTYPNLVNHEAALNWEYLKWSDRCTPEHNLMLAFTRQIAGPMDYHLGGFRSVARSKFKPVNIAPLVLGTRCHMLAMYVCFDNCNPMLADYPTAYEDQPGFDFLKAVPTWWDETRVLIGDVGELLVTARRKGKTWYLGGLAAGSPRELSIPLSFLGSGQHSVTLWKDSPESDTDPNFLSVEKLSVTGREHLKLRVATDGGFVAAIEPMGQ